MEKILKNGVTILAILIGVCGILYQKTGMKFFDYATVISCAILVGLTIYNITVLVDNVRKSVFPAVGIYIFVPETGSLVNKRLIVCVNRCRFLCSQGVCSPVLKKKIFKTCNFVDKCKKQVESYTKIGLFWL